MTAYSLRARWVLPVDGAAIHGGFVSIAEGRIAAVGGGRPAAEPVHDLGDVVLLPGLVNAHTHLEFSDLAAPLGSAGMRLPAWIRLVIAERKRSNRDAAAAIAAGLAESLAAGVTMIGEIATLPASAYEAAAVRPRAVLFQEAIGFSAGRVASVFGELERRFIAAGERAGLSPHAPYTAHPQLVERIVQLAAKHGAPVAMHVAESREELQLLADGGGDFRALLEGRSMWDATAIPDGWRPRNYLRILAGAPRALVIHGNYLAADEIEFIGRWRDAMSVVFCPRTHAYFDHAAYPLTAMLAAGIRVALGTDSRASNPDLSLLAELRFAARRFADVDAATFVRMATLDGAVALGLGEEAGSVTPGKRADLVALSCPAATADPYTAVVDGEGKPLGVWMRGEQVAGDKQITRSSRTS